MKDKNKLWQNPHTGAVITDKQKKLMEQVTKGMSADFSKPYTPPTPKAVRA